jgi:hypothetical protein
MEQKQEIARLEAALKEYNAVIPAAEGLALETFLRYRQ